MSAPHTPEPLSADGHLPHLEKAHDVRHLGPCQGCPDLGDMRMMLFSEWHGRCYIKQFELRTFLALPLAETNKVSIADIGGDAMKRLVERRPAPKKFVPPFALKPLHLSILRSCEKTGQQGVQSGNLWLAGEKLIKFGLLTKYRHDNDGWKWRITNMGRAAIAKAREQK